MTSGLPPSLYKHYYKDHPDRGDQAETAYWDSVADEIVRKIQPATVLDAGCGKGFLVKSLRQRGVEAWGLSTSEATLRSADLGARPYCWVGSMTDPFPLRYDLIVSLETLEALPPDQIERAIHNLCQHSDDILFSSIPFPLGEEAATIAQPPEYWARVFAQYDYVRDLDFAATFVAPWAIRFRKLNQPMKVVISSYERRLWRLQEEIRARREFNIEQRNELATKEARIQVQDQAIQQDEEFIRELTERIDENDRLIQSLNGMIFEKDTALQNVLNSRSWRLMQRVHKVRHLLIPSGSRREKAMYTFFHGLDILRRDGPVAFSRHFFEKLSRYAQMSLLRMKLRKRPASQLSVWTLPEEPIQNLLEVNTRQVSVDIVICVHNALSDVQRCLESVIRYTSAPYTLILVDDGSDKPTQGFLGEFAHSQGATLLRNSHAEGYTRAANLGIKRSSADYVVLLNSDTIVTPHWLYYMVACAESDAQIGLVGPLSNTASWQSVPEIFNASGDWADNPLPTKMTVAEMGELTARNSAHLYPRLPLLNGFCLMVKRQLIEQIGYFDEETYGEGYGEENDYCLRALEAGWLIAVADDAYVYHAQSRSYSHERRMELVKRADKALVTKYGQRMVSESVHLCRNDRVLQGIRARNQVSSQREALCEEGRQRWEGRRILFLLPIADPGGGGNVVVQEAEAMCRMGVDVRFANLLIHRPSFERGYPGLALPTVFVEEPRRVAALLPKYDAAVATVYHSVRWMDSALKAVRRPVRGYYIQDFEPDFFPEASSNFKIAWESYTRFPDLVRLTKTEWNRNVIKERIGVECTVVGPSVNIDLFRPRRRKDPDWPRRPLRIAAMIRPSTPRRQPELTMQILKQIAQKHQGAIEIVLFGCQIEDPDFRKLITDFPWRNAGVLTSQQLAFLLNEMDVFVDFSAFQAMGLTAMESMACGAAVIVPKRGGANSFAKNESNALVVDTSSPEACFSSLDRLLVDEQLRHHIQQQAMFDICQLFPEQAALNILNALFE